MMAWIVKLWWNFTLGCLFLAKGCVGYWTDHLPHSPAPAEAQVPQPKPVQGIELVEYQELE